VPKCILFEGLDNCFKTTNIRVVKDIFASKNKFMHSLHYSAPRGLEGEHALEWSAEYYHQMFQIMRSCYNSNINVACDRSHIGEWVYGQIYRKYTPNFIWKLEKKFAEQPFFKDTYLLLFVDSASALAERDDGQSFSIDPKMKNLEKRLFLEAFTLTGIHNRKIIDVGGKDRDQVAKEVRHEIGE
jgi:thymidylate kinase